MRAKSAGRLDGITGVIHFDDLIWNDAKDVVRFVVVFHYLCSCEILGALLVTELWEQ